MFGAMTRDAERWRSIRFTEFGRRQTDAVRKELVDEYKAVKTTSCTDRQAHPVTHKEIRPKMNGPNARCMLQFCGECGCP